MILYRTAEGLTLVEDNKAYGVEGSLDSLVARPDLHAFLSKQIREGNMAGRILTADLLPPIGSQEVWA
ncbi:MAG: 2-hydroxyhepta-2,4-diene-1,7-dioate isomerase, partial [Acidobacteriaceae bacterium]